MLYISQETAVTTERNYYDANRHETVVLSCQRCGCT